MVAMNGAGCSHRLNPIQRCIDAFGARTVRRFYLVSRFFLSEDQGENPVFYQPRAAFDDLSFRQLYSSPSLIR
jgi:hypothetical protein